MYYLWFLLFLTLFSDIYAITFVISLDKLAEIDIQLAKQIPEQSQLDFSTINLEATKIIARYSMLLTDEGKILLWQNLYSLTLTDIFIRPEDHFVLPQQKNNPLTITLSSAQMQELAGPISQIYVIVRQRLYYVDPITNQLTFLRFEYLMQQFVPLNMLLHINASGAIAPEKNNNVATGTGSVS